jgi:hypothetical protein
MASEDYISDGDMSDEFLFPQKQAGGMTAERRELYRRVSELTDWIKAANGFAWAHERTCPRHDADAPCNCGLDQFLSRPRPTIESYAAQVAELERELRVAQAMIQSRLSHDGIAATESRLAALEDAGRPFAEYSRRTFSPHTQNEAAWLGEGNRPVTVKQFRELERLIPPNEEPHA